MSETIIPLLLPSPAVAILPDLSREGCPWSPLTFTAVLPCSSFSPLGGRDRRRPWRLRRPVPPRFQIDVVIVELHSPVGALIRPSHRLEHDQLPLAGLLASPKEKANYLNYLDRLEKRMRVRALLRTTVAVQSGERATVRVQDARSVPPPVGFVGSIGIQFEDFGVRVDLTPVLLADGTFRLDVATELTSENREVPDRRTIRGAELKAGETLLLAGPEDRYEPYRFHGRPLLLVAAPNDRYIFLITPRLAGPANAPSTDTTTTLTGAVRDGFRSLDWQLREIQAEIETWWDDWRSGIQEEHDLAQLRAAPRRGQGDDPTPD